MKDTYRILHLEDIATDAELVARELKKCNTNFEHLVIETKDEYLEALNDFKPDIILCDHSLPSFNSIDALRILKSKKLFIPFLLITATMSEEVAMRVVNEGADDYILKDRLKRLPNAVINSIEKFRFEKERHQLIEETREKEAFSKTLLQNFSDKLLLATKVTGIGIWEYGIYNNQFAADENLSAIYGIPLINFDSLRQQVHPQDKERVTLELSQAILQLTELDTEFRIVRRDGAIRYIKGMTIIQRDAFGSATRIIGTNQDVTADKIAEQALKESEAKYRSFFENSLDSILITVPDGRILSANPAACGMFKMTEAEICAAGRAGMVDATDERLVAGLKQRQLKGKAKGVITFLRKDGSCFDGEITTSVYGTENGEERTSMIIRDVTESKKAEVALRESEAFNRGVLDSLSSHIAVINKAGTIVKVNKPWRNFAIENGGADNDVFCEGANYFDILDTQNTAPGYSASQELCGIKKVLSGEISEFYLEYSCHSPEEERWFYMRVQKFESAEVMAVIEHHNITELKLTEAQLTNTSVELKKALTDVEQIMDSSLDIICTVDEEGRFSNVSSAAALIWGYQPEELMGTSFMDYVFADDKALTEAAAGAIRGGKPVTMFENRYVKKDGTIVPILWSAKWDEDAKMIFGIAKDATEKKRIEAAFNSEKRRLQELFTYAPAGVGVFKGPEHRFEIANDLYLKLTGRKSVVGKTVREVFPEVENQGLFELLDQVFNTGIPFSSSEHLIKVDKTGDGRLEDLYLNFVYHPYKNIENKTEGVFFFAVDVTEQVEARKRIEESEKRFRQLIENLPEALYTCDANGKIKLYNRAAVQLWGREPHIEKDLWCGSYKMYRLDQTMLPHEESPVALTVKSQNANFITELIFEHSTGERRYARANPIPLFDQNNNLTGAVNMLVDITHIKQVEEKLRTSNERYQFVTKATNDGIWDWNLATNEMYWNKSYERISGYKNPNKKLSIEHWFDNIHPGDKERVMSSVLNAINSAQTLWEDEYRYVKADGETVEVHDRGYIMYDEQGKASRFVGALSDITQRKKIEIEREHLIEHLVKSNNDLKQFSYITSHNFRAPLSNLLGLLNLVDHSTLTKANEELVKMFEKSTQQLNKTINDLIQILIIKKNVNVNLIKNNVAESIDEVCELLASEIKETQAIIVRNLVVKEIILNKSYMQSILINLLSNAIKYRSANRMLVIEIATEQKQNGDVLMAVKDNGSGIDMGRYHDRIFGLYQRFHSDVPGAGLGLYMVKTQIMALGGKIEVQSEEEKGTTFYITFRPGNSFMLS